MIKIIQNEKVIDVVRVPSFIKFLSSGHIAYTGQSSAEGVVGSDETTVYSFTPVEIQTAGVVTIEEITLDEFERLQALLSDGKEVIADESALTVAKKTMIRQLSSICKNKITAGFEITLSDGETYGFKLTTEDQLNLLIIENQINAGMKTFVYHATNLPCKLFNKEDMVRVVNAFKSFTLYHTTYFNAAKQYINTLTSIDNINKFVYGMDVSEVIEDPILKQILKKGGTIR
jgi:hypothetical protein